MELKSLKAFTPYILNEGVRVPGLNKLLDITEPFTVADPLPTQWRSIGFTDVQINEQAVDIQGAGVILAVQINERILPGPVLKEAVETRVAELAAREGRKVGKKEYAQVRDEMALELLPRALIRRKTIPVLLTPAHLFVFSSSAKLCDDITALLLDAFSAANEELKAAHLANVVISNPTAILTMAAKEDGYESEDTESGFTTTDTATLKGSEDKRAITVKDREIQSHEVQELLKDDDYSAVKLGLTLTVGGDEQASFVLSDKLTFTRLSVVGVTTVKSKDAADMADSFLSAAWLTAVALKAVMKLTVEMMGGIQDGGAETTGEDDDL